MKKFLSLALLSAFVAFSFAQAPAIKKAAKTYAFAQKIEMQSAAMAKAKEMAAKQAAATEVSSSVIRTAAKPQVSAAAQSMVSTKVINNAKVARVATATPSLKAKAGIKPAVKSVKKATAAPKFAANKAAETADFVAELAHIEYYGWPDYDWYYCFNTTDGLYQFRFDIGNQPEDALPLDQEFTYADMIADYTWGQNRVSGEIIEYAACTFKATQGANGVDYVASVEDVAGNIYNLTCAASADPEITDYKTYEFSADEMELVDYTQEMGLFQLCGYAEDGLEAYIAIASNQLVGTYNMNNVYLGYTNVYTDADDYTGVKPFNVSATVTETGATVVYDATNGVEYTFIFHFGGDEPGDEPTDITVTKDVHGIITSVEGGVQKAYVRSANGTAYFLNGSSVSYTSQSGTVTVVEDGDKVYIKDPITRYTQNTWVEGTKNGNQILVAAHQPLVWNDQYSTTISLRYGVITAAGNISSADDYVENFVFDIDGDVMTLLNTAAYGNTDGDAYFMGALWDDDDSFTGYGDAETVLTYDPTYVAPSTDLVTPPASMQAATWYLNATSVSSSSEDYVINQEIAVGFVGNDVYVQGLFEDFPEAWVKGTIDGMAIVFSNLQYIGNYAGSYDMYFAGTDGETLVDATATIDSQKKTIAFANDILANAATDRIYYLTWLRDATLTDAPVQFEEPVITDLMATLPYFNGFDTEAEQSEAAIYDANRDGKTFTFYVDSSTGSTTARYAYHSTNAANDYVVFPGLELVAGNSYKVSVDARGSNYYPEKVELCAATEAVASAFAPISETLEVHGDYETLSVSFVPEADGVYYLAIHAVSDPDEFYLYTDNFSVKMDDPMAPKTVSNLAVVADPNAELRADIYFTTPSENLAGESLGEIVAVTLSRDGEVIDTAVMPCGAEMSMTDTAVTYPGYHIYSVGVATVDGEHIGDAVSAKAYVGEDTPLDVENLAAADHNTTVGLSWTAPGEVGANGGIVKNVKYNVYPVEMFEFFGMLFPEIDFSNPYALDVEDTNYEVAFDTNSGEQAYTYFGVTAANEAGESGGAMAAVLTGAPYAMPMVEGLTGQALHYWWGYASDDDNYDLEGGLYFATDRSSDGDNVCFAFMAETAGWIDMQSGKIAANNGQNVALAFDYISEVATSVDVVITTPAGETVVKTLEVAPAAEWATAKVSLAEFADQPWVRFTLHAEFAEAGALYVDNVVVMDMLSDNLVLTVKAPKNVTAGKSALVVATIKNEGENVAEDYTVNFYINDMPAAAPMIEPVALEFMQSTTVEFELETSIFDQAGDVTVKAEVVYAADLKAEDNADEVVITVLAPSAAPVESVAANYADGALEISWVPAASATSEVVEDFESYDADVVFADGESCGDWKAVDLSQGSTYSWNSGAWNHMGEAYAFGIIDVVAEGLDASFEAASGTKMALFMSEVNADSQMGQAADKYMISPELPGVAQTISFAAQIITAQYGAEEFEVMVSTTDDNAASFTSVQKFSVDEEGMAEYSVALPEGAKYFAIHYTSNDIFGLFVDDVTYTTGGGEATGYNVYIDQVQVAAVAADVTSCTYAEALSSGEHEVSVTAVYGVNESAPVTVVVNVEGTGINSVAAAQNAAEIYNLQGIRVNAAQNGVYVIDGVKTLVK